MSERGREASRARRRGARRSRRVALAFLAALAAPSADARAESLTPSDVIRQVVEKNPTLRATVQGVAAARASVDSESARYDPTLKVTLGGTRTRNPSLSTNGVLVGSSETVQAEATLSKTLSLGTEIYGTVGSTWSRMGSPIFLGSAQSGTTPLVLTLGPGYLFSAKAGVTQPLLRGAGRDVVMAAYDQALAQRSVADRERDRQASTLARDALSAYWELWYASAALAVDRAARDVALAQRDDALARTATGSLARADVLTFETQLASKEETVMQSELDRRTRANDLARLLGRDAGGDDLEIVDVAPPDTVDAPAGETDALVARALASSPDVGAKRAAVELAAVKERTAADPYRARLDLDAYVQAQGLGNDDVPSAFTQLAGLGALSAHVGLTLELPLTATRARGEADRARATTESAESELTAAKQSVASDVSSARHKHELARRRVELASESVRYAEAQLDAEKERFKTGSGTALQVIQSQDSVQSAAKRLARARADRVEARLALSHLTGDLLSEVASAAPRRASSIVGWSAPRVGPF
ncbi:MAG: TolC family protein [Labilithrix sp.]|nr:TolC family protein [Labilithrix sp.]MCW5832666.1 TolC family protein [Labilithrix sp.]